MAFHYFLVRGEMIQCKCGITALESNITQSHKSLSQIVRKRLKQNPFLAAGGFVAFSRSSKLQLDDT
jgi:hypothetical protein